MYICVFVFLNFRDGKVLHTYQIIYKNNDRTIHSFNQQNFPMCFIVVHCCAALIKRKPATTHQHYNVVPPTDNIVCLRSRHGMYSRSKICTSSLTSDTASQKNSLQSLSIGVLFSLCPLQKRTN